MILVPQEIPLYAGDMIELEYRVVDQDEKALAASVHAVKRELSQDPRFHYQGSRMEAALDPVTGTTSSNALFVSLQVADLSKVVRMDTGVPPVQPLEAGMGKVVTYLATLITLAVAAVYVSRHVALTYLAIAVNGIRIDEKMSDETKQEAMRALNVSRRSLGSTMDSVAKGVGGLGVLLALAVLAYLVFGSHR